MESVSTVTNMFYPLIPTAGILEGTVNEMALNAVSLLKPLFKNDKSIV